MCRLFDDKATIGNSYQSQARSLGRRQLILGQIQAVVVPRFQTHLGPQGADKARQSPGSHPPHQVRSVRNDKDSGPDMQGHSRNKLSGQQEALSLSRSNQFTPVPRTAHAKNARVQLATVKFPMLAILGELGLNQLHLILWNILDEHHAEFRLSQTFVMPFVQLPTFAVCLLPLPHHWKIHAHRALEGN